MTSKERVIRTLRFEKPDRIPLDFWTLPATAYRYGEELERLKREAGPDILSAPNAMFRGLDSDMRHYEIGTFTDEWGSGWRGCQRGIVGEVKEPVLDDIRKLATFRTPIEKLPKTLDELRPIADFVRTHPDHFILGGWIIFFERMQFVRGPVNLYMDIFEENDAFFRLRDMLEEYYSHYLDMILQTDVDAVVFADDWGAQHAMLISPEQWRRLFKPVYRKFFDRVKRAGKFVFMHSDGYIYDIFDDLIELGVDAINSQVWCMGPEKVGAKCRGRITFWGELDRQHVLPNGTPEEVQDLIAQMKEHLYSDGGLIGQSEPGPDTPLSNIEVALKGWNE